MWFRFLADVKKSHLAITITRQPSLLLLTLFSQAVSLLNQLHRWKPDTWFFAQRMRTTFLGTELCRVTIAFRWFILNPNFYYKPHAQDTGSQMARKIAKTGNKTCTKHLLLSRNFARWPILMFCMHVTLSVPIQIEAFGRKLLSGILFNSENAFFNIT